MNVISIELVSEIHRMIKYKITYEKEVVDLTVVDGNTYNYSKELPEQVIDFVEWYISG